jgi:hypothetical protein
MLPTATKRHRQANGADLDFRYRPMAGRFSACNKACSGIGISSLMPPQLGQSRNNPANGARHGGNKDTAAPNLVRKPLAGQEIERPIYRRRRRIRAFLAHQRQQIVALRPLGWRYSRPSTRRLMVVSETPCLCAWRRLQEKSPGQQGTQACFVRGKSV